MSTRWKKVLRDLWYAKTRTLLVVISIAVGVFAFGTIANARATILRELHDSFLATNPASAIIHTSAFDDDLVEAARRWPGVGQAAGRLAVPVRISIGPDEWYDMRLYVIPDDGDSKVNIVRPLGGPWPPPKRELFIERSSLPKTRAQVGDTVLIETPDGKERDLRIAGVSHDLSLPPAPIAGQVFGYISFDTLEWLGLPRSYNQLLIVVADHPTDKLHIQRIADEVATRVERSGRTVSITEVPTPQKHPAEDVLPTILLILGVLGILALLLSGFLIINTIGAILAQQTRQIGIMKAIGARTGQVIRIYLSMVLVFGLLALLLALPLGALGALGLSTFVAGQLNVDIQGPVVAPQVLAMEVAASLLVPLLTAIQPILATSRVTVREAISDYGIGSKTVNREPRRIVQAFSTWISALLSRPLMLSLRNTFRRKGRLIRTLVALTLGGAVFLSVLTLRASLFQTLDEVIKLKNYDIEVRLNRPYRIAQVEQVARQVPAVVGVEGWGSATVYPVHDDGSEGDSANLYALPATSTLLKPKLAEGRWLVEGDGRAVVISSNYRIKEPNVHVGDSITLKINDKDESWRVVGVTQEFVPPTSPALVYVTYDAFVQIVGDAGQSTSLRVATTEHDPAAHAAAVSALNVAFEQAKIQVKLIRSLSEDRAILNERFNVLTAVLSIMATLIGLVGGLGLMGTMSINVLERTREIGVMRAIGASNGAIRQIVIAEGIVIGMLAWFFGVLVSLPLSRLMCYFIGINLLNAPLSYTYAFYALLLWLVVVLVIAALASLLPAYNASRLTVREVLAYE